MQANATINWAVYDYQDLLFDSGSGVTGDYGWISFSPNIPESYTGRLKVVTTTMSPAGMVSNVAFRPARNETGVFGVVLEANSGTVTITSLDSAISPVNANVTNGSFSAPSLTSARGRFRAAFVPTSGPSFFKFFNKDASDYFLLLTPPDLLQLATAVSRKTHGLVGTFDIDLPLNGSPGIECRSTGGAHTLVFTFNNNVTSGNASITAGIGSVSGSPTFAANTMTVNLTGVADIQKITVALDAVRDAFGQTLPNRSVSVNMLSGDTTGNKTVNASDVAQTKVQSGAAVTALNFRTDVTVNGVINASDVNLVKSRSGSALP